MSECAFKICDGSGFLYDEETNTAHDCRCRPQIVARNKARGLSAVIPVRYRDIGFDRFPVTEIEPRKTVEATRHYASRIQDKLDAGSGLSFVGPIGTGKTTLAMLVTKSALEAGRTAARYSLPGLLSEIRKTFDSGLHNDLLAQLTAVDLLHIDDIGAEQTTPWVLEELYSIVNARYEDQRSMVITTNITDRAALREQISERTVSRLTEMCEELWVAGDDNRQDTWRTGSDPRTDRPVTQAEPRR
ncbi:MAG TPA: ATP-binding protein [Solirubrobacteraceae bacterium]|jgi:DNA replication protein DnaC